MNSRKKYGILTGLLLFIFLLAAWLRHRQSDGREVPSNFQLQDSTTIGAGKMEIKIWDYSVIDGDTVNIIFDGKKIFNQLLINDTPAVYNAGFVEQGKHWLGVEALTEGFIGAATTHVSITNGRSTYEFDIEAHKNKPAYRLIKVE